MIELASVIGDLREELEQAVAAAEGAELRFELGTIELEVSVALERTGHAGAKVRFWVVESGADATVGADPAPPPDLAADPHTVRQPAVRLRNHRHQRGLVLVTALATRWGVLDRPPVGKTIRAELDL
ncbi:MULTISPECIES: trypco2 family protein [unclassified Streptomyces]|uniref:trypco2 family protein n=1 Tax=unclassified Streptomyces TaxID=2593676 RepID=UPI00087E5207|nr:MULTISPECIES: trypco2 family protein [unclassified Streptomyces]PBC82041.1 hypothetical protein BX261_1923 [Streptomyces sp. 2321.6]SDR51788.1 hypothetical protein SAMN05216511_5291 [Streptomyces sp. KS_16]SEC41126.1 hypothetical protein SAMN05428940_1925 [Streptomyces sp. 2133.1]SNC67266.1 hypothetical protein SAMN06272741_1921 [Streptomyces sp. 2114.4]